MAIGNGLGDINKVAMNYQKEGIQLQGEALVRVLIQDILMLVSIESEQN